MEPLCREHQHLQRGHQGGRFQDGKAKIELALAKGKKSHDKRSDLMEKQANREITRELSRRTSGKSER